MYRSKFFTKKTVLFFKILAKDALESSLVHRAQYDIFGTLPNIPLRSGAKELKKNLAGPKLVKAYPIHNRLSKVMPSFKWEKGIYRLFQRSYNVSQEMLGIDASEKAVAREEGVDEDAELAKQSEIERTKKLEAFEVEQKLKSRFSKLVAEETSKQQREGRVVNRDEVQQKHTILLFCLVECMTQIVLAHFIDNSDIKADLQITGAAADATSSVADASETTSSITSAQTAEDVAAIVTSRLGTSADSIVDSQSSAAMHNLVTPLPFPTPKHPAKLPHRVLFEHTLKRAIVRLQANQKQQQLNLTPGMQTAGFNAESSTGSSSGTSSAYLANVMQKMNIAPEVNLGRMLYGPTFFYSSPEERYSMTPHSRPVSASQMADELQATERRSKVMQRYLEVAPHEFDTFLEYCNDTASTLYMEKAKRSRFAQALKTLSNPESCMQLGELDMQAAEQSTPLVRLMLLPTSTVPSPFLPNQTQAPQKPCYRVVLCDADGKELTSRSTNAPNLTNEPRDVSTDGPISGTSLTMSSPKLLSFATAHEPLLRMSKQRDASDRQMLLRLEAFCSAADFVSALDGLDIDAQKQLLGALMRKLNEEEAMYEAVELAEIPAMNIQNVSLAQLHESYAALVSGDASLVPQSMPLSNIGSLESRLRWLAATSRLAPGQLAELSKLLQNYGVLLRRWAFLQHRHGETETLELARTESTENPAVKQIRNEIDLLMSKLGDWCLESRLVSSPSEVEHCVLGLATSSTAARLSDADALLCYLRVQVERESEGKSVLACPAIYWLQAIEQYPSPSSASSAANVHRDSELTVQATRIWLSDQNRTIPLYEPFHPMRRNLIALRHRLAACSSASSDISGNVAASANEEVVMQLRLLHQRAMQQRVELEAVIVARLMDPKAITEEASLEFYQRTWRSSGGYQTAAKERQEDQREILGEMGKYKAAKKGQGKRAQKRKK